MNIATYLKRINIHETISVSLESLMKLQKNHLLNIPFGNLDVIRKVPITLSVENYYHKIIERHREGYCYELNGLFNRLLTEIGFDAYLVKCTVYRGDGVWAKEGTHAAQIVALNHKKYLVDVGFGRQNLLPVALSGEVSEDNSGYYRITNQPHHIFHLERLTENQWIPIYRFNLLEQDLSDYAEGLDYNQNSPKSTFTHHDIVTIATETGRITLRDRTLSILDKDKKEEQNISENEFAHVLNKYFGIAIKEVGK